MDGDVFGSLNLVLGAIASVATVIATYFAWKDYDRRRKTKNILKISDKVIVYPNRQAVLRAIGDIIERAQANDIVFGQCKACTDYPELLERIVVGASGRGVRFKGIVSPSRDGVNFARRLGTIRNVNLKFKELKMVRIFGNENKEVLIVVSSPTSYVGIRMLDETMARHLQVAFAEEWKNAKALPSDALIDHVT